MKKPLILFIALIGSINCSAQSFAEKYLHDGIYWFDDTFKLHNSQVFTTYKSQFGLTQYDEMVKGDEMYINEDSNSLYDFGSVSTRYYQYYKGLPVEQKLFSVSSKCNIVMAIFGSVVPNLDIDTSSHLTDTAALVNAMNLINPPLGFTWQNAAFELSLKMANRDDSTGSYDSTITSYPTGKLVIAKKYGPSYTDETANYALCWKYAISYLDTVHRDTVLDINGGVAYNVIDTVRMNKNVYVNATTGEIWAEFDPSMGAYYTNGKVWTWHYGDQFDLETLTYTFKSGYGLVDSKNIRVFWTKYDDKYLVVGGNNAWDCCEAEREPATAMWSVRKAWEYFASQQGISHWQPINIMANSNVRPSLWQPHGYNRDEDDILIRPGGIYGQTTASDLDLMGHEFAHIKINRSSQIGCGNFANGEPFVVSEALADIMGLLSESWFFGTPDWSVGGGYMGGTYRRRFFDPENDVFERNPGVTGSVTDYGDQSKWFNDYPYSSGGFIRKWFNHTALGASNWNPIYTPLGIVKAGRVAFIAMYWNVWAGSNVMDYRNATLGTARIHYGGICSPVYNAVEKAWADVGVGTISPCNKLRVSGAKVVNSQWILDGKVNFSAVIPNCEGGNVTVQSYDWLLPQGWTGVTTNGGKDFKLTSTSGDQTSREIALRVVYSDCMNTTIVDTIKEVLHISNECSMYANRSALAVPENSAVIKSISNAITVYPNPVSKDLHVVIPSQLVSGSGVLQDIVGNVVKNVELKSGDNVVSISGLPTGIYILRISTQEGMFTKKISIK